MKYTFIFCLLVLLTSLGSYKHTSANTVAGGEIIYIHLGDSAYQVICKMYLDCGGNTAPDSIPLCVKNSCNNNIIAQKMGRWVSPPPNPDPNGKIIGVSCPNTVTTCNTPNATITGYRQYWYTGIVFLPAKCAKWTFSTHLGNRNSSSNLQNSTSQPFYIEATLNNSTTNRNSSPYNSILPEITVEQGLLVQSSSGILDSDGDSLYTYLVMPMTGVTQCSDTAKNMSFASTTPSFNLTNNPFQTSNTFVLNQRTGQYGYTPTNSGKSNITFRTDEYRNGVLIGSIMRDLPVQALQQGPVYSGGVKMKCGREWMDQNQSPNPLPKTIYACPEQTLTLCYDIVMYNPAAKLFISDNHLNTTMANAVITYTNQGTDSVHVEVNWRPGFNNVGLNQLMHTIYDSTCTASQVVKKYMYPLDINVWGKIDAGKDITICEGSPAYLNVNGGGNYRWYELPGGSTNSISDTTIPNPVVNPTKTTTYLVLSTLNGYCTTINKDTVTVHVNASTTGAAAITNRIGCGLSEPGLNYVYLCPGKPVSFCLTSRSSFSNASLYMSDNISTHVPGAQISYSGQGTDTALATFTWTPNATHAGLYTLILTTYDSACAKPNSTLRSKQYKLDFYVWPPTRANHDSLSICRGETITLTATGGMQYKWTEQTVNPVIADPYKTTQTIVPTNTANFIVTSTINTLCSNNSDTVAVSVTDLQTQPSVSIQAVPDNVIRGGNTGFIATATGCKQASYEWYVNGKLMPDYKGSHFLASNLDNMDKVWCRMICDDRCANDTPSNVITMRVYNTGITNLADDAQLTLYPNPNNGVFTLQVDERLPGQKPVAEILDIYGRIMYTTIITDAQQSIKTDIPAGIYMLRVRSGDETFMLRFSRQ